jgi:hypothetical protein
MITASHTLSPASLSPAIIRRRALRQRPLLLAPPSAYVASPPVPQVEPSDWRDDLRFFVGCYIAGLAFFLIMLS